MSHQSIYDAAGGIQGLLQLAHAWHELVVDDPVVGHAFSHGFKPDHTARLAAYWAEALGGPANYSANYGDESSVVRLHSGNGEHQEMDELAIAAFDQALERAGMTSEPLRGALHDYFAWATRNSMAMYHQSSDNVPAGLTIPRWTWSGLKAIE